VSARLFDERRAEPVRGILRRTLGRHAFAHGLERHVSATAWEEAVGAELAARAQPTALSAGVLHVVVVDHRWRDQIDAVREMIIARVNARLGRSAVRRLQFGLAHAGALPAPRTDAARDHAPVEPSGAERLPEELREAVVRAATAAARARRA
jgi:predicted nucleic acid-binding Zn ribbon protein